jgi:hypothetical protein
MIYKCSGISKSSSIIGTEYYVLKISRKVKTTVSF